MPVSGGLVAGGVLAGIAGLSVVGVVGFAARDAATPSRTVERVIDGDTIEMTDGERVRLIGIDTPELGDCGAEAAKERLTQLVLGEYVDLVNPTSVQDADRFDRLLRYVDVAGSDAGLSLLGDGLAVARYDSQDGYDAHPRQNAYRNLDRATETVCERDERLAEEQRRAEQKAAEEAAAAAAEAERIAAAQAEAERIAAEQAEAARLAEEERRSQEAEAAAAVEAERQRQQAEAEAAAQQEWDRQQQGQSRPSQPSTGFVPPQGWTTDALTPGYTGCRQGYPGGKINGIYVWKPIPC